MTARLHIALFHPEIPQNTGNIGRLCLGVGATLHLVHPLGFSTSEKAVRRAGLDYWKHVQLTEHRNEEEFWRWSGNRRVHLFSKFAERCVWDAVFEPGDVLIFGCETKGLPAALLAEHPSLRIPMPGPVRSLTQCHGVLPRRRTRRASTGSWTIV